jgi:hypothetical protein
LERILIWKANRLNIGRTNMAQKWKQKLRKKILYGKPKPKPKKYGGI